MLTTLTNVRKRGGTVGPTQSGATDTHGKNSLMMKFLNLKTKNLKNGALHLEKISMEDRKRVKQADMKKSLDRYQPKE